MIGQGRLLNIIKEEFFVGRRSYYQYEDRHDHKGDHYCVHNCKVNECDKCQAEGALVEKVVCSCNVLTDAEFALPFAVEIGGPGAPLYELIAGLGIGALEVNVTPDYNNIRQEATVLHDAVMIFGTLPADVTITIAGILPVPLNLRVHLYFQEIVDCKGACPGDRVAFADPVIERTLNQPLLSTGRDGGLVVNLLLFKAIIRTHVTVSRRGIERNGKFHDLDPHRCHRVGDSRTINTPYNLSTNTPSLIPSTTPLPPAP